jgi:hypothetical protein
MGETVLSPASHDHVQTTQLTDAVGHAVSQHGSRLTSADLIECTEATIRAWNANFGQVTLEMREDRSRGSARGAAFDSGKGLPAGSFVTNSRCAG